jgi:hypothetical protein
MMIGFDFKPDPERARALNGRMHGELAASLRHVAEEAARPLGLEPALIAPLIAELEAGVSYPAATFARYYDLVVAIDEEEFDEARNLYAQLCAAKPVRPGLQVAALGDASLGAESERYQRMMNEDPSVELGFTFPPPEIATAFRERLHRGWGLLDRALPELSGEIRAIIREVVIAGSDPTKKYQFDGGSHYRLWGALFLNGQFHPDDVAVCEVLAHESAHSLLFGFTVDEALQNNDDDELFSSPLRADPRPMDGIYHATFVSARMHWAMTKLANSGVLTPEQRGQALEAAASDLTNFDAGYGIVAEHGILTETGAALMKGAHDYMQSVR